MTEEQLPAPGKERMRRPPPSEPVIPVEVHNEEPLSVVIEEPEAPTPIVTKSGELSLPPTTTAQEDIVVGRQAAIGRIWEYTQSVLSVMITVAVIWAELTGVSSPTLSNAFFFVVSLYLIRTNHSKIGGIGPKANEPTYRGR